MTTGTGLRAVVAWMACGLALAVGALVSVQAAGPATAATSNRGCRLLTKQQVKAAIGAPVSPAMPAKTSKTGCEWQTIDAQSREYLTVEVLPLGRAERARFTQLAEDPDNEVVDDLGDQAVLECGARRSGECFILKRLWVRSGDEYLGLSLVGPADTADEVDALVELAGHAVDKL